MAEKDENGEKEKNMQAENVEKIANCLVNFGGIFQLSQLPRVKILSVPVSLIILAYDHWLAIFIDENVVEIMDSTGHLGKDGVHKFLRRFLYGHIYNKQFTITPPLQDDQSNICGLFALAFLYYRTYTNQTLCEFVKLFSTDKTKNCKIIQEIYETIVTLEK